MALTVPLNVRVYPRRQRPTTAEEYAAETLRSALDKYARHIRRLGVRFEEVINGNGDVDQACRVSVTLTDVFDAPKFVVEGRAPNEHEAANLAADGAAGAVRREVEDWESVIRKRKGKHKAGRTAKAEEVQEESYADEDVLGVREGERDGSTPRAAKSSNFLRKRGIHKTQRQARANVVRELPATRTEREETRPSRKSTRKSANRSKHDSNQARRAHRAAFSSEASAERSSTGKRTGTGRSSGSSSPSS